MIKTHMRSFLVYCSFYKGLIRTPIYQKEKTHWCPVVRFPHWVLLCKKYWVITPVSTYGQRDGCLRKMHRSLLGFRDILWSRWLGFDHSQYVMAGCHRFFPECQVLWSTQTVEWEGVTHAACKGLAWLCWTLSGHCSGARDKYNYVSPSLGNPYPYATARKVGTGQPAKRYDRIPFPPTSSRVLSSLFSSVICNWMLQPQGQFHDEMPTGAPFPEIKVKEPKNRYSGLDEVLCYVRTSP
jgi:hypothetical protein